MLNRHLGDLATRSISTGGLIYRQGVTRRQTGLMVGRRLLSSEGSTVEPSSEETAQQLGQLLE